MSVMTIELRKERNEARHQSTCIHMVTYCKTRWVRPQCSAFVYTYIFIYRFVRRALNLLRASFSPIFQYFSAVNDTRVSFSPIFHFNIS